jgi:hypothetical protein
MPIFAPREQYVKSAYVHIYIHRYTIILTYRFLVRRFWFERRVNIIICQKHFHIFTDTQLILTDFWFDAFGSRPGILLFLWIWVRSKDRYDKMSDETSHSIKVLTTIAMHTVPKRHRNLGKNFL